MLLPSTQRCPRKTLEASSQFGSRRLYAPRSGGRVYPRQLTELCSAANGGSVPGTDMHGVLCTPLLLGACHENGSVRSRAIGAPELTTECASGKLFNDPRSPALQMTAPQQRNYAKTGILRRMGGTVCRLHRRLAGRTAATTIALWRGNQRLSPRRGKCASVICSPSGPMKKGTIALRASSGKVRPASLGWRPRRCVQSCAPVGWSRAFRRVRARAIPLLPLPARAWLYPAWRADRPPS